MNKNKPLENLSNINEVYDNQAEMIEEITYYNKVSGSRNKMIKREETILNSNEFKYEENDEVEDENFVDASEYINAMKKTII